MHKTSSSGPPCACLGTSFWLCHASSKPISFKGLWNHWLSPFSAPYSSPLKLPLCKVFRRSGVEPLAPKHRLLVLTMPLRVDICCSTARCLRASTCEARTSNASRAALGRQPDLVLASTHRSTISTAADARHASSIIVDASTEPIANAILASRAVTRFAAASETNRPAPNRECRPWVAAPTTCRFDNHREAPAASRRRHFE